MIRSVYKSCNCKSCKNASSKVKRKHKNAGHRAFRRKSKLAIREGHSDVPVVSTGYKT